MTKESNNWITRAQDYIREVQGEFNKITWPPQSETMNGTVSVVVIVGLVATFLSRVMQMVLG